jgi:glycogen debranching enzyme
MLSRRSFIAGVSAAYFGSRRKMNAVFGAVVKSAAEPVESRAKETRIGNFYYQAPNGIAFIKDDEAAFVINPGGSHNAGTVAPDDSFHHVIVSPQKASPNSIRVEFQWSRMGDIIVGRLLSDQQGEMSFTLGENWPGFSSRFSAAPDGVEGVATLATGKTVTWRLKSHPAPKSADENQFTLILGGPGKPAYLVAGFGELPSLEGIDSLLAEAQRAYEKRRTKARGPSGDILAAISDNLNNSRIYSSDNKMVAISVSRSFGADTANRCPFFCWDSFFSTLLACLDNPEMGRQTVRAILSFQSPDGIVPNFAHWHNRGISTDRSQPPVGSMCIWKMHQRWPDLDFLREVYSRLALWHGWWMKARNARNDGLLQWGSSTGNLQFAQYETGWDDTPHFEGVDGVKMVGATMNVYAVDLCSLWAMDAHYLALIADAIGRPDDAKEYRRQETAMIGRINAKLWNEELGIYCSRFWDKDDGTPGEFLTRLTPANFYPLICRAPNAVRAQKVLAVMTDPAQFWGDWILPTVSRKDPLFLGQTYWHGTIWGPVNYLVFQGVKHYATPQTQADFAQKSVHLFMNNWLANGFCGENFFSIDGSVGGNHNYTWGALLCLIGIESVIDIGDDGVVRIGPGYNEAVDLLNLPVGGKLRNVASHLGRPQVTVSPG